MANALRQSRVRRITWAEVQYPLSIEETFAKGIIYVSKHTWDRFMERACQER